MRYDLNILNRYLGKAKANQRIVFFLCNDKENPVDGPLTICSIDESIEDDGEETLTIYMNTFKERT